MTMPHHDRLSAAFWVAAIAAVFLTACSSDTFPWDSDEPLPLSPTVTFTLADADGSRGFPIDSLKQLKDFRADAYLHRDANSRLYFSERYESAVGKDSLVGVYRSENAYLWPKQQGDKMSFVAVAPYSVAKDLNISQQGSFTYTVPDSVFDQCDLMFASATDVNCPTSTPNNGIAMREPVPLKFKHLLTQVRFVFGRDIYNYWRNLKVHSVRVENVASTGTWNPESTTWTNLSQPVASYEIVATPDSLHSGPGEKPHSEEETEIWLPGYSMFLMPQTLPEGSRVAVDMSYIPSAEQGTENFIIRDTCYIYLDNKKLLPGHTVIVEINSNYTFDCEVVNDDGSDVELRPLSPKAGTYRFRINWNAGGSGWEAYIDPLNRGFAYLSTPTNPTPGDSCVVSGDFTVHTTDNNSPNDRFIRIVLTPAHGDAGGHDHFVVLKQRGMTAGYGTFDDTNYPDTEQIWGFDWPTPFNVVAQYEDSTPFSKFLRNLDYGTFFESFNLAWISKQEANGIPNITFDYDALRNSVRTANSPSDGLTNSKSINTLCHFPTPFEAVRYLWENSVDLESLNVNGTTITEEIDFNKVVHPYDHSAVMEAVWHNGIFGGATTEGSKYVDSETIKVYLPSIEELETIAGTGGNPLVPGRTYWSSTVNAQGNPIALQINTDGSTARITPGASTSAWVHAVKAVQ